VCIEQTATYQQSQNETKSEKTHQSLKITKGKHRREILDFSDSLQMKE